MGNPTCARCATEVVRIGRHGPWPKYCSAGCKAATAREAARSLPSKYVPVSRPLRDVVCHVCGGAFRAKRQDARLCSNTCGNRDRDLRGRCSVEDCTRGVRAKGKCDMHHKADLRAEGRIVQQPWNDRRRNNAHARRARMQGAPIKGSAFLSQIIERDGGDCHLCGEPVDMALTYPDPRSKSVDHVVPLARGGAHAMSNCALAHLGCNVKKGAKIAA